MKFKVSKNDLIVFIIFCILLLYLCAIGVLNFVTFGKEGHLWGLNPIPAFGPDYIGITLLLFIASLVMIFTSVSSHIFTKEKGGGIGIKIGEKDEKGYNRFGTTSEMKGGIDIEPIVSKEEKIDSAGVALFYDKKRLYVDNGEYHTLVIGSSGSGKTRCVVKPLVNILSKKGESMIITDPKGEIYEGSANHLKELGYNVIVLNFREPAKGSAWNPLTLPYQYMKAGNKDKALELLDDVALNILYDPNNKNDPFWEKSAADYFAGCALGLFEDAKPEETNINSISVMTTDGEDRLGASNYIKEYFLSKGTASTAYINASNTINAPSDTKGGILSTFRQKIRLFASRENLSEMLGHSDFNMLDIGKGKTAVFIIIQDEKTTYHSLATIFIKQCYETLIDVAQQNGGKLPTRTNFILDEFANMPPLKDVDSMVTAARSRLIRFTFIIQNFAQLNDVYGKEVAEVIRGNCGNTIYLISSELAALEEISKMCGEVKSGEKDKTASTPLITVTDLQKMKFPDALIMRMRMYPYKTKLPCDDQVDWGYTPVKADYPTRELKPIAIFDIKEFVKNKKQEQMMNQVNSAPINFNGFNPNGMMPPYVGGPMPQTPINPRMDFDSMNLSNEDLDKMIADIDKRIAELDAEEALEKAKAQEKDISIPNKEEKPEVKVPNLDDILAKISAEAEEEKQKQKEDKNFVLPSLDAEEVLEDMPVVSEKKKDLPKINIDADSIVSNNNVISDDEFFDDFFADDDE